MITQRYVLQSFLIFIHPPMHCTNHPCIVSQKDPTVRMHSLGIREIAFAVNSKAHPKNVNQFYFSINLVKKNELTALYHVEVSNDHNGNFIKKKYGSSLLVILVIEMRSLKPTRMFFSVWPRRAIAILPLFSFFSRKLWPFRIKRIGIGLAFYVTLLLP